MTLYSDFVKFAIDFRRKNKFNEKLIKVWICLALTVKKQQKSRDQSALSNGVRRDRGSFIYSLLFRIK